MSDAKKNAAAALETAVSDALWAGLSQDEIKAVVTAALLKS